MGTCLVTGANGFVGRYLCAHLAAKGYPVRMALRRRPADTDPLRSLGEAALVGDVDGRTDWSAALRGVETVVHLANRAHVMREDAADPLARYRAVNAEGTRRLAEQAAAAGVRRIVYASSTKVLGEATADAPFRDGDPPAPQDPYAVSKREAEQALLEVASTSALEATILRPPLVYGPGVGANFLRLMRAVARGIPLPLAAIDNRRSMIYAGNLADGIEACLRHPAAAGKTYLIADGPAVSTATLVAQLAAALNVPDRSWRMSPGLLMAAGALVGKGETVRRLVESLDVDDSGLRADLGWTPRYSFSEGLRLTAEWFRSLR